ncbi:MAG: hypothetical protein AB7H88_21385 [Vicinamibacterales bacterium]
MAIQSNVCVCENCVGAQCTCGCQAPAAAAPCQCGEVCNCGEACNCGNCQHADARIRETR